MRPRPRLLLPALALLCACHGGRRDTPPTGNEHRLEWGETLSQVAERYHVSLAELVAANHIADPDRVPAGLVLVIPRAHPVQGAGALALTTRPALQQAPAPTTGLLAWPVRGIVSSLFGTRDGHPHQGIDIAVPDDTPVRAAAAGEVVYAGSRLRGYGHLVMLRHDGLLDGLVTIYAHNSKLLVQEGQRVARGQIIARSGHSGHVTGPHVHFEVRANGAPTDPYAWLPPP